MKKPIGWPDVIGTLFLTGLTCLTFLFIADLFVFPFLQGKFRLRTHMPDLIRMDSLSAAQTLAKSGFRLSEITRANNDSIPAGRVVSQVPAPGREVKKTRHVRLLFSLGREMITVPNLTDLSPSQAGDTLQRLGLRLGEISEVYSTAMTPGAIMGSTPRAGHRLARGGTVNISISQNNLSGETYVPDLQNTSLDNARETLSRASLRIRQVSTRAAPEILPRTVLEQSLKAGTRVEKETFIDLVVSE